MFKSMSLTKLGTLTIEFLDDVSRQKDTRAAVVDFHFLLGCDTADLIINECIEENLLKVENFDDPKKYKQMYKITLRGLWYLHIKETLKFNE